MDSILLPCAQNFVLRKKLIKGFFLNLKFEEMFVNALKLIIKLRHHTFG
jgi:hypothetical protein